MEKMVKIPLESRALSLLDFNDRVLSKAKNKNIPLIERFKFTCIVSSNLDEFYEIRFAEILERSESKKQRYTRDGVEFNWLLDEIGKKAKAINNDIQKTLYKTIIPALDSHNIHLITDSKWPQHLDNWTLKLFKREIENLVSPIVITENRPFPNISNKTISYIVSLEDKSLKKFGIVQLPKYIPRVFKVPGQISKKTQSFIFIGALMREYMQRLFPDQKVIDSYQFKITRNSDLYISEDAEDLRNALQGGLSTRDLGAGVRIEVSTRMPKKIISYLKNIFSLRDDCIFSVRGPSNLFRFVSLLDSIKNPQLKFAPFKPKDPVPKNFSIFKWLKDSPRLIQHPYESFNPVVKLINEASTDPDVLSIKQTIYRTGDHSPIMLALMEASKNGKEVTVVIELMARFDEETNFNWSAKLESVGAHVIHSPVNFKCHAKMLLITRRELDEKSNKYRINHYAHLGTGNYSPKNAMTYTDYSFLTTDKIICKDINQVFQKLAGSRSNIKLKKLWHSPEENRSNFILHLKREIRFAKNGKAGKIIIKVNSLCDHEMIQYLYRASSAGVKIDLIVRGMCSLIPNLKKHSENIRVHSVIGRFLEHHRIFYFGNNGQPKIFLSSADWLERNLNRRFEVTFPVEDKAHINKIYNECLMTLINDKDRWVKVSKGLYKKVSNKKKELPAQEKIIHNL